MPKRQVWDILKFHRETEDGARYYTGRNGMYLFLFNGETEKAGKVILNRKFLTSLFRSRYSSKVKRYLGDLRAERKFLLFDETGRGEITVYWTERKK